MFRFLTLSEIALYVAGMTNDPVRQILLEEIERRRLRNPSYSLRALARDLSVSLTALSDAVNGKRRLSKKNVDRMVESLMLSPEQAAQVKEVKLTRETPENPVEMLSEDVFRLIGDWHYFAILNLAKLPESKGTAKWVAKRLGIPLDQAQEALDRLERLNFVKRRGGKLERTARPIRTTRDIPSVAIRKHHLGNLRLAEDALFNVPVEARDFGATMMPMNPAQMDEIKKYLQKVQDKVVDLAVKGDCSEVYCLSLQFFPLTKL